MPTPRSSPRKRASSQRSPPSSVAPGRAASPELPIEAPVGVSANGDGDAPRLPPIGDEGQNADEKVEDAEEEERHRIWDLFAEEYHDIVTELPLEYHRTFLLLSDLEATHQAQTTKLREALKTYVTAPPASPAPEGTYLPNSRRRMLEAIANASRDTVRSAEEKVGLAVTLYEAVDRQIQSLDASLLRSEDSLSIGLRAGTLPSHDAPAFAPKSPPGRTTGWGARALDGDTPQRVRGRRKDRKGAVGVRDGVEEEGSAKGLALEEEVDPNEPTYCFCERVSFGQMIGCENDDCEREWFHLRCVGLEAPPEDAWYCSDCVVKLKIGQDGKRKAAGQTGGDRKKKKKAGHGW